MEIYLAGYLVAVNAVTFALFGYDKYCAQHDMWRVRESTLLIGVLLTNPNHIVERLLK